MWLLLWWCLLLLLLETHECSISSHDLQARLTCNAAVTLPTICAEGQSALTMVPQRCIVLSSYNFLADLSQERTSVHGISDGHVHAGPLLWLPGTQLVVIVLWVHFFGACSDAFAS
jgi:hypothetical protein